MCLTKADLALNIGCGTDTFGDIRVDIRRVCIELPDKPKTAVNVLASTEHLPFRDLIFRETRCWHVLEHVNNPKKAIRELKRVTYGTLNIRVPIWHLYSFLIESIAIIRYPKNILSQLKYILKWKERYGDHKWYIRFRNANIRKSYKIIPKEYEVNINGESVA